MLKESTGPAVFNGAWTLGFAAAFLAEGRKRRLAA